MRVYIFALMIGLVFPVTAEGQFESDQETLNIEAEITELQNLEITKITDLDFGDIRYFVTGTDGSGTYGWSSLSLELNGGNQFVCASDAPSASDVQIVQLSSPTGAGLNISGDQSTQIHISFSGIEDPSTDPHLLLARSGGAETLRVGNLRFEHATRGFSGGQILSRATRTNFNSFNINAVLNAGLCIIGEAELTDTLVNDVYSTTFDVTASYN